MMVREHSLIYNYCCIFGLFKELTEIFGRNRFVIKLHHVFQRTGKLLVDAAFNQSLHLLFLFHHLGSILLKVFVGKCCSFRIEQTGSVWLR